MIVCGLDFETDGLDTENGFITEIGAVLWDTEQKRPVSLYSALLKHPDAPPLTPEIVRLTGITDSDLQTYGIDPQDALTQLNNFMGSAVYILAHNGKNFDLPMYKSNLSRYAMSPMETPWIDTDADVPYPDHITTRKLTYLCTEHNFLNPFAHRAVFDVLSMLKVISHYPFAEIEEYAKQPTVVLKIAIPPPWEDGEAGTKKAKELSFRYDGKSKSWRKSIKESRLEKEINAALPYKVVTVA